MTTSTIGVIGGMGPEATNRLCTLITAFTPVSCDQEHIPVIAYSNSKIPGRVDALSGTGASPVPELIRTARVLEQAGAHFLIMPCNIAHYFIDDLRCGVQLPLLNMIEETVKFLLEELPGLGSVGILSATPTHDLYRRQLKTHKVSLIAPSSSDQELVMESIYSSHGIKCGYIDEPAAALNGAAQRLLQQGADVILSACTEVSVALAERPVQYPFVDSLQVLAEVSVDRALAGFCAPCKPAGKVL